MNEDYYDYSIRHADFVGLLIIISFITMAATFMAHFSWWFFIIIISISLEMSRYVTRDITRYELQTNVIKSVFMFTIQVIIALLICFMAMTVGPNVDKHNTASYVQKSTNAEISSAKKTTSFKKHISRKVVDKDQLPAMDEYINYNNKPNRILKSLSADTTKSYLAQIGHLLTDNHNKVSLSEFNATLTPITTQISNESWESISHLYSAPQNQIADYKVFLNNELLNQGYKIYTSNYDSIEQHQNYLSAHKARSTHPLLFKIMFVTSIILSLIFIFQPHENRHHSIELLTKVIGISSVGAISIIFINIHNAQNIGHTKTSYAETFNNIFSNHLLYFMKIPFFVALICLTIIIVFKVKTLRNNEY